MHHYILWAAWRGKGAPTAPRPPARQSFAPSAVAPLRRTMPTRPGLRQVRAVERSASSEEGARTVRVGGHEHGRCEERHRNADQVEHGRCSRKSSPAHYHDSVRGGGLDIPVPLEWNVPSEVDTARSFSGNQTADICRDGTAEREWLLATLVKVAVRPSRQQGNAPASGRPK